MLEVIQEFGQVIELKKLFDSVDNISRKEIWGIHFRFFGVDSRCGVDQWKGDLVKSDRFLKFE